MIGTIRSAYTKKNASGATVARRRRIEYKYSFRHVEHMRIAEICPNNGSRCASARPRSVCVRTARRLRGRLQSIPNNLAPKFPKLPNSKKLEYPFTLQNNLESFRELKKLAKKLEAARVGSKPYVEREFDSFFWGKVEGPGFCFISEIGEFGKFGNDKPLVIIIRFLGGRSIRKTQRQRRRLKVSRTQKGTRFALRLFVSFPRLAHSG